MGKIMDPSCRKMLNHPKPTLKRDRDLLLLQEI